MVIYIYIFCIFTHFFLNLVYIYSGTIQFKTDTLPYTDIQGEYVYTIIFYIHFYIPFFLKKRTNCTPKKRSHEMIHDTIVHDERHGFYKHRKIS